MSETQWIVTCAILAALVLVELWHAHVLLDRARRAEASRDYYVGLADRRLEQLDAALCEREEALRDIRLLSLGVEDGRG